MSYKPPFKITNNILLLIQDISKSLGFLSGAKLKLQSTKLRKSNKIKTIQSSLAIEGNNLTINQITVVLLGKRVSLRKISLKLLGLSKQFLKSETIEQEKVDYSEALKDAFSEAKSLGFDIKIIKHVLKLRKKDKEQLAEEDNLIELYRGGALDVQAFLAFAWYYFSNLYMISDNLTEFTKKA